MILVGLGPGVRIRLKLLRSVPPLPGSIHLPDHPPPSSPPPQMPPFHLLTTLPFPRLWLAHAGSNSLYPGPGLALQRTSMHWPSVLLSSCKYALQHNCSTWEHLSGSVAWGWWFRIRWLTLLPPLSPARVNHPLGPPSSTHPLPAFPHPEKPHCRLEATCTT